MDDVVEEIGAAEARGENTAKLRKRLEKTIEEVGAREIEGRIDAATRRYQTVESTRTEVEALQEDQDDLRTRWRVVGRRMDEAMDVLGECWEEHEALFRESRELDDRANVLRNRIRAHGFDLERPERLDMTKAMGIPGAFLHPIKEAAGLAKVRDQLLRREAIRRGDIQVRYHHPRRPWPADIGEGYTVRFDEDEVRYPGLG